MKVVMQVSGMGLAVALAGCAAPPPATSARVSGQVEASEVRVAAEVGGRILDLAVAEGDRVAAGDRVATLDVRDAELQIARARADRALADAQLRLLLAVPGRRHPPGRGAGQRDRRRYRRARRRGSRGRNRPDGSRR